MPGVDVHHHILPPAFVAEQRDRILRFARDERVLDWKPAHSLELLDRVGIDKAYTSLGVPGTPTASVARACNEFAADLAHEHPGRFGTFAALPLPDVDGSLAELAYAYDELYADGVALLTSYGDRRLGDPFFLPVLEALDERRAVVHLHPTVPAAIAGAVPGLPDPFIEFPFDTTRAVASLVYSGTLERCPHVTFILSHGGGALPMLAQRLGAFARMTGGPNVPALLDRFYADTVTVASPPAVAAAQLFYGADRLLLGTDTPYVPVESMLDGLVGNAARLGL